MPKPRQRQTIVILLYSMPKLYNRCVYSSLGQQRLKKTIEDKYTIHNTQSTGIIEHAQDSRGRGIALAASIMHWTSQAASIPVAALCRAGARVEDKDSISFSLQFSRFSLNHESIQSYLARFISFLDYKTSWTSLFTYKITKFMFSASRLIMPSSKAFSTTSCTGSIVARGAVVRSRRYGTAAG